MFGFLSPPPFSSLCLESYRLLAGGAAFLALVVHVPFASFLYWTGRSEGGKVSTVGPQLGQLYPIMIKLIYYNNYHVINLHLYCGIFIVF